MAAETNLNQLLKNMSPRLNTGEYVFCQTRNLTGIDLTDVIGMFRETEAYTLVLKKETADRFQLPYSYIAAWITLTVHSSLEAVGLTAAFSKILADEGISCNVMAAYYHDHIFVNSRDAARAMHALTALTSKT